jgi:hypothetical protein
MKTKEKNNKKETRGRKPKYSPWMNEVAKRLSSKGLTNKDIYFFLGISEPVGIEYKNKYPEFAKSLKEGKKHPTERVKEALLKRALGYNYDSEKIVVLSDGSQVGSHYERVPVKEHVIPNIVAQKLWLYNNDRENWFDKESVELKNKDGEPFVIEIK